MENPNPEIREKGGFLGFLRGTQPLSTAFWIIGVIPAIVIFFIMLIVLQSGTFDFKTFTLFSFVIVGIHRLFAWISIIRCRKNTTNSLWAVLAIAVVVIDILYKLLFSTVYINKVFEKENNKKAAIETIASCKQKVSELIDIPVEELEANTFLSYIQDKKYYAIKYGKERFKCFIYPDSIEISHDDYLKYKDKTLQELLKDKMKKKQDSLNKS